MSLWFRRRVRNSGAFLVAATFLACVGCAGHAGRTLEARSALDAGHPGHALDLLDDELDVESARELPEAVAGDNALLLLDRAMILQELGSRRSGLSDEYKLSSRDFEIADKQVEILDFSRNAAHDIGRFLFSDETGPYKAPAYEKLMINTMNMMNYLARGDLNGGRVEARRLAVMQQFISEHEGHGDSLMAPGSYLAGFIFEKSGNAQEALRYYDEALRHGSFHSLEEPIRRLARVASYRSPRIRAILESTNDESSSQKSEKGADKKSAESTPAAEPTLPAEILVVINFGRVPAKIAKRIPIGLALTYASGALSPNDRARASYLAAQGLVTWVNYPELGRPRGEYDVPGFALAGRWQRVEGLVAVDEEAHRAWQDAKGTVVAAAITRMLSRVVAGEATRRAAGGTLGALLSLGAQVTLTALDTPDTRSWATLPARVAVGRVVVPPGTHWVYAEARGVGKRQRVVLQPGGWAVVVLTVLH